jgi:hypothetical protein
MLEERNRLKQRLAGAAAKKTSTAREKGAWRCVIRDHDSRRQMNGDARAGFDVHFSGANAERLRDAPTSARGVVHAGGVGGGSSGGPGLRGGDASGRAQHGGLMAPARSVAATPTSSEEPQLDAPARGGARRGWSSKPPAYILGQQGQQVRVVPGRGSRPSFVWPPAFVCPFDFGGRLASARGMMRFRVQGC